MNIDQKFNKALLLLDKGNNKEAEILLREIIDEAEKKADYINLIRGLVCLGDFLFGEEKFIEAKIYLKKVLNSSNNDLNDLLDFEFNRATELLNLID